MAATVQSVRDLDLGGAFSALTEAQIQTYLDLAARMIDASVWGDCYDQAHALLGAHLVQEATQAATGAVGPVTSASAGGLSVSYGGGGISGAVSGTRFAEMLNDLWDACGGAASGVIASRHSCGEGAYPMFFAAAGSTSAPSSGGFTDAYKTKLDGIADGATANASDADLRDRATHTGTQTAATISDFAASVDVRLTGFAPLASPTFTGTVTAPNPPSGSSDQTVATTSWVRSVATGGGGGSVDLTPLTNRVTALEASQTTQDTAITARAPLASPALTGVPTAPTASTGTSTTQVATTAFVAAAIPTPVDLAPLTGRVSTAETKITALETSQGTQDTAIAAKANTASPTLTGAPKAPTPAGTATGTEIATAAFVLSKIPAATDLGPLTARVGALETSQGTQDTAIAARAPLASPALTGNPTAPTQSSGNNSTRLATTAFVQAALPDISGITTNASAISTLQTEQTTQNTAITAAQAKADANETALAQKANLASPTFTGTPQAPTPANSSNDTSIATTAFVKANGGGGGGGGPAPDPFPYWNRFTVFSTTGNASWTAPAGVTEVVAVIVGAGGGGGGGCNVASGSTGAGGGGGGAGAVQIGKITVTPGTAYPLVIGNGGAGGAGATGAKAADGSVGENSTGFGLTANGGGGGIGGNTTVAGTGGPGATVSGGDQNASNELKSRGTVGHLDGQYVPSVANTVLSAQTPYYQYDGFCRDGQDGGQGGLPALTRGNGRNGGDGGKGQLQQAGGGAGGYGGGGGGRSNGAGGGGGWGILAWGGNGSRGATSQGLAYFVGYGGGGGGGQPGGGNPDLRFERQNAGTGNYSAELAFNTGSGYIAAPGAGNGGGGGGGAGAGGGGGTGALAGAENAGGTGAAGRIVIYWHA